MESTVAVKMEPLPVLEDVIMEYGVGTVPVTFPTVKTELSEESGSDCEGEAEEDEPEDGRAHTPDGVQDMCCKLEIEENNILEDSSGCRQSPGLGGLQVRHEVAGSSVQAADRSEPDLEIPVPKESYECHFCFMGFSQVVDLVQHTRISHTGAKPFKCKHCGRCFRKIRYLKIHIRTHTGEKLFYCEHCNKCFTHRSHLIEHSRLHTGEKPFACEDCNKCFTYSSVLITHRRLHTGEKPFSCEHCNKCFTQRSTLNYHVRKHRGE